MSSIGKQIIKFNVMKTRYNFWLKLLLISFVFIMYNCKKDDLLEVDNNGYTKNLVSKSDSSINFTDINRIDTTVNLKKEVREKLPLIRRTYVPDDNFELALINLGYDKLPLDDYVPTENINKVKKLSISSKNIFDLTGIEDFKKLESLFCSSNNLKSLDLSQNLSLTHLCCNRNSIKSLNVSQNKKLLYLYCNINLLKSLDLSNNIELKYLDCNDNNIESLDISKNINMKCFFCKRNCFTSLNISNNTKLAHFNSKYNLNLDCIKVNKNQLDDIPSGWQEDVFTEYKIACK